MSKIRLAEYHYRKAVEIHPNNAVLLGCVGMVSHGMFRAMFVKIFDPKPLFFQAVERRGDRDAALALFDQAEKLSPDNALVRYRRAKILISMKRYPVHFRCRIWYNIDRIDKRYHNRKLYRTWRSFETLRWRSPMWCSN
jgi:tetratricopeptide (TPR) repeat protein